MSKATKQLSRHLLLNFSNLRLFGIELKPGVSLIFTVEQGWVQLSWLQIITRLTSAPVNTKWAAI